MGFVRMSPSFVNTQNSFLWMNSIFSPGGANVYNRGWLCTHNGQSNETGARWYIMGGAVPTSPATLPANFNARASDALVLFDPFPAGGGAFSPSQTNVNPAIITSIYVNAIGTGTATWFWILTGPFAGSSTWNNSATPYQQIVGTVGVTGSGADLTLPSTSITTGSPYRIYNYRLQIPTEWTF